MVKPKVLILHANGTNRDNDSAQAIEAAGGEAHIHHLNELRTRKIRWDDFQALLVPGGFSYADALGAGRLLAIDLNAYFTDEIRAFVGAGKPVIGICNGFQALVKSGILPGRSDLQATLTFNESGKFECRWVRLGAVSPQCVWTAGLSEIHCPVAHGEGRFVFAQENGGQMLAEAGQIALVYLREDGSPALGSFPANPSGSQADIAGVCNPQGNVLGLMPHPENHIFVNQYPLWTRGQKGSLGLQLFINGMRYAAGL